MTNPRARVYNRVMNYYIQRWECDWACDEIEDTEGEMPMGWETVDGEELCESCAKIANEDIAKREADDAEEA